MLVQLAATNNYAVWLRSRLLQIACKVANPFVAEIAPFNLLTQPLATLCQ